MRNPLVPIIGAVVIAGSIVTGIVIPIVTGSSPMTAAVWVSPTGSDNLAVAAECKWHNPPIVDPGPSKDCATFGKTYALAVAAGSQACGQTVGIETGLPYARQDMFNTLGSLPCTTLPTPKYCRLAVTGYFWSSSQDLSGCLTYQAATSQPIVLDAGGGSQVSALNVEVNNVRFLNFSTPRQTDGYSTWNYFRIGDNVSRSNQPCSAWNVHDVVFDGLDIPEIIVHASSYVYVNNFTIGHTYYIPTNGAGQMSGCNNLGSATIDDHTVFMNGSFRDGHNASWTNPPAPALVQSKPIVEQTSITSVSSTFASAPSLANTVIATVASGNAANSLSCSMDGAAMTLITSGSIGTSSGGIAMFQLHPVPAASAGTVTCTTSGGATSMQLSIQEFAYISLYPFGIDKNNTSTGSAVTTLTTGSITPAVPGNCSSSTANRVIAIAAVAKTGTSAFSSWGSGYIADQTGAKLATSTTILSTSSATTTSQSWGASEDAGSIIADFKCSVPDHTTGMHLNTGDYSIFQNVLWVNNGDYQFEPENANAAPKDIQHLEITNNVFGRQCADTSNVYDSSQTFCPGPPWSQGGALPLLCHQGPRLTGTTGVGNGTTTFTVSSGTPFVTNDFDSNITVNGVNYTVTAFVNSTTLTLSSAVPTGSGLSWSIGWAKFGPVIVRTSSFDGTTTLNGEHAAGCDNSGGVLWVGDITSGAQDPTACTNWQGTGTNQFNWSLNYMLYFNGVNCGSNSTVVSGVSSIYVDPSYPTLNFSNQSGSPARGSPPPYVPSSQPCPPGDYNGNPNTNGCSAGAFK